MLGLVVEGGASRTVYSCGVMEALMEQNIKADYFCATETVRSAQYPVTLSSPYSAL